MMVMGTPGSVGSFIDCTPDEKGSVIRDQEPGEEKSEERTGTEKWKAEQVFVPKMVPAACTFV
jgi:hypothetical protein